MADVTRPPKPGDSPGLRVARGLAAAGFVAGGVMHFVRPGTYARLIPPGLPSPIALVVVSGLAEIAGGVGLLMPRTRRPAGWGLIALLVAVFPANVYMAARPDRFTDLGLPTWALWLRLPLQGVLIWWVRRVSIEQSGRPGSRPPPPPDEH